MVLKKLIFRRNKDTLNPQEYLLAWKMLQLSIFVQIKFFRTPLENSVLFT